MKSKWNSKLGLAAVGLMMAAQVQAHVAVLSESRCDTWGDSLEQNEAPIRANWASKHETDPVMLYEIEHHLKGTKHGEIITPGYPTYARFDLAQRDWVNDQKWFAPPKSPAEGKLPDGYRIAFFCASGCYAPGQKVLFLGGYESLPDAENASLDKIMALDPNSTLESPRLIETPVAGFIKDIKAGKQTLLVFKMKSGGKLEVTEKHPLVDSEGRMRAADSLSVGESLVKADGSFDAIQSIEAEERFTKVYNVNVRAEDARQNIVVAQGYLNGALYFQNDGVKDLNRRLLRRSVTEYLVQN